MFPGFFSALAMFMFLDILSPFNITELILKDSNAMIGFFGFIFLVGTILGVMIDGFHHKFIELKYFSSYDNSIDDNKHISAKALIAHLKEQLRCKDVSSYKKKRYCESCFFRNEEYSYELVKIYYAFNINSMDKCIALHDYLRRSVYHYYEFYANTFIAMIPFTFITPLYLVKKINFDISNAFIVAVILFFLTIACLQFAWMAYERWLSVLYFAFGRCLSGGKEEGGSIEFIGR